jgi:hypothetical protein
MNKRGISNVSKIMIVMQLVIVIGAILFFYYYVPRIDSPENSLEVKDNKINFKFRNANVILIDDDSSFDSPKEIDIERINISEVKFSPGTYYIKAVGIVESLPKKFVINSTVGLELKEGPNLANVGNVPLEISLESENGTQDLEVLRVDIEYPINDSESNIYRGKIHEE